MVRSVFRHLTKLAAVICASTRGWDLHRVFTLLGPSSAKITIFRVLSCTINPPRTGTPRGRLAPGAGQTRRAGRCCRWDGKDGAQKPTISHARQTPRFVFPNERAERPGGGAPARVPTGNRGVAPGRRACLRKAGASQHVPADALRARHSLTEYYLSCRSHYLCAIRLQDGSFP